MGKKIQIEGLGFGDHPELVDVEVEGNACQVTAATRSHIECEMPELETIAGSQFNSGIGLKLKKYTSTGEISPSELRTSVIDSTATLESVEALIEFETFSSD